ncbi:hypothetical protein N7512_007642 [Penicillium capsulatum]|nr:hypothetical protein N7512_007642 [Penicillium capsulatum]
MQNTKDIGWLDVGVREDSRLAVLDHGRLQRVVDDLSDPDNQCPSLCVFLGGNAKSHALQQIYTLNNIKRHVSEAQIKLRYDIASLESRRPVLLADGNIPRLKQSLAKRLDAGMGLPVSWDSHSTDRILQVLWSRLIFVFTDVVCIFIDDTSGLKDAVQFLVDSLQLRSASPFPPSYLPRVILIYGPGVQTDETDPPGIDLLYHKLQSQGYDDLSGLFSSTTSIYMQDSHLSDTAKFQRLKAVIAEQRDAMSSIRQEYQASPSATHLTALFRSAFRHTLDDIDNPFDIVQATREDRPVNLCLESHLAHYLEIGLSVNIHLHELAPSIASALFMDHYVPGMLSGFRPPPPVVL